jgi:hypothetical protein
MPYLSFRLYSGTTVADADRIAGIARSQLIPKVRDVTGFGRYVLIVSSSGQVGSLAVFNDERGSDEAKGIAADWVRSRPDFASYKLALSVQGEVGLAVVGSSGESQEGGYGIARLYKTKASFEEVNAAIEKEGIAELKAIPGLVRYTTVRADDGRYATFSLYESEASAQASVETARQLRRTGGSQLSKLLPDEPEVIETRVIYAEYRR